QLDAPVTDSACIGGDLTHDQVAGESGRTAHEILPLKYVLLYKSKGTGIAVARVHLDGKVFAADFRPVGDLAGENVGKLGYGQFFDRIIAVTEDGDSVECYLEFRRLLAALGFDRVGFFRLDLARGRSQVGVARRQRLEPGRAATAKHAQLQAGIRFAEI